MSVEVATASAGHVVETSGLTKLFGKRTAVAGVDLRLPAGCAFGFLGPNGAGKTTLIRMLLGLTPATAGEMRLLGLPVPARRREALRRIGAIVEEPRFHGHLTGRENLRAAAAVRGHECYARIQPVLDRVGLQVRADERVRGYSLGMRQRLGIARCLLSDPALLILDEPMNGLDPAGILEMRGLIRTFVDEGRTVFLSSHLLDEVERTCDQVAIIDRGHVVTQGATAEVAAGANQLIVIGCDDPGRRDQDPDRRSAGKQRRGERRRRHSSRTRGRPGARRRRGGHQPAADGERACRAPARAVARLARGALPRDHLSSRRGRLMLTTACDMIAAEGLKLRKRRGLFWWSFVLTIISPLIVYSILEAVHLFDGADHGPAGGTDNFFHLIDALGGLVALAAVLIGTTTGAGDVGAGVFRDLVATGRSRLALFAVRLPGATLMFVPLLTAGYAVTLAGCYGLAGDATTPDIGTAARAGSWLLVSGLIELIMGLGLSALIRSRGIAIGVLLSWIFAIGPILASLPFLGFAREALSSAAVDRLRPVGEGDQNLVPMSLAAAILVMAAWAVVFLAAGAWRTSTQDA